jgi:HSP20 family molecular chaperone IbpA
MCAVTIKTRNELTRFLQVLDEKSRAMLWHLWWYRHADISELRELIDAVSDFEVLYRLKEVINEQAQRLWGRPVVGFEQAKIDSLSGEKVLFSWWFLDEENVPISDGNKPLVDIFNEKEGISIIAQVPSSVDPTHHEFCYKNGILKVGLVKRKINGTGQREKKKGREPSEPAEKTVGRPGGRRSARPG